jgi:anaphase-promoting complex subunit 4
VSGNSGATPFQVGEANLTDASGVCQFVRERIVERDEVSDEIFHCIEYSQIGSF